MNTLLKSISQKNILKRTFYEACRSKEMAIQASKGSFWWKINSLIDGDRIERWEDSKGEKFSLHPSRVKIVGKFLEIDNGRSYALIRS